MTFFDIDSKFKENQNCDESDIMEFTMENHDSFFRNAGIVHTNSNPITPFIISIGIKKLFLSTDFRIFLNEFDLLIIPTYHVISIIHYH